MLFVDMFPKLIDAIMNLTIDIASDIYEKFIDGFY
jgi:hypothetical protein